MIANSPNRSYLSERIWPIVRILIVQLILFVGIVGNLAAWGIFVLLVDKLNWLDIDYHGKTLGTVSPDGRVLGMCVLILTNLILVLLAWRLLDRKRPHQLLWSFQPGWSQALMWGLLAGVGEVLLVYGALLALGTVRAEWGLHTVSTRTWAVALGWLMASSVLAPLSEEIWYRGYVFQNIKRGWGIVAGTVASALLFGGLHLLNPNAEILGAANIAMEGLLFILGMLWLRSLWFPIGWHAAWNFAQFFLFGLPNSGFTVGDMGLSGTTLLVSVVSGPRLLTGGDFGMEASITRTIILIGAIAAMFLLRHRRAPQGESEA